MSYITISVKEKEDMETKTIYFVRHVPTGRWLTGLQVPKLVKNFSNAKPFATKSVAAELRNAYLMQRLYSNTLSEHFEFVPVVIDLAA